MEKKLNLNWLVFLSIAFLTTAVQVFTYQVIWLRTILSLSYFFLFLLAFRSSKKVWEVIVTCAALVLALFIQRMFMFGNDPRLFLLSFIELMIYTVFYIITFVVDRIVYRKCPPIVSIFVFPVLFTTFVVLGALFKLGNYLDPFYDVFNIQIFAQVANLIFEYGIVFIMCIIYTLSIYLIKNNKLKGRIVSASSLAFIFVFLLVYGGISLNVNSTNKDETFKAAALYTYNTDFLNPTEKTFEESKVLFTRQMDEAKANGADLVVTHEEYFSCKDYEEIDAFNFVINKVREVQIPTLVCFNFLSDEEEQSKNIAALFDKDGDLEIYYIKTQIIPIVESGKYKVGEVDPGFATIDIKGHSMNLSTVICADINNPIFVNSMNKDTDLLLVPSWDFGNYSYIQKARSGFRAIENKVSMFKITFEGQTFMIDPAGNTVFEEYSMGKGETVSYFNVPFCKK